MEKYKNSVADIELPNVKKWNSVLTLKDDQEVIEHQVINSYSQPWGKIMTTESLNQWRHIIISLIPKIYLHKPNRVIVT